MAHHSRKPVMINGQRFHRILWSDDSPSCLVCGAVWIDEASFDAASMSCSGDTRQVHGDLYETGHILDCDICASGDDTCEHVRECDCDACN